MFLIGLALFGLASLLIGVTLGGEWLIATWAFHGVAAAIVAPSALALLAASFLVRLERICGCRVRDGCRGVGASLALWSMGRWRTGCPVGPGGRPVDRSP